MCSEITAYKIISMSLVIFLCGQRKDEGLFQSRAEGGGGVFEVSAEGWVWLDKSRASQRSGPWYRRGRVHFFFLLIFPVAFFPHARKKRWALELGWNVIIGQHQTRELPIKVLGYKQHLFQIGLRLEELSLPLPRCLYHRSGTNYQVSFLSPCFSHLISSHACVSILPPL